MELQRCMIATDALIELIMLQLKERGRASLTVTGNSMYPMLQNCRDQVELVPVSYRQERKDVILYCRDNGQYILHRIISLTRDGYICCGDNQFEEEFVRHDQLLAVVDGFTRNEKKYSLRHPGYRLYADVWVGLFSARRYLLALRRRLGRLRRKLLRGKKREG